MLVKRSNGLVTLVAYKETDPQTQKFAASVEADISLTTHKITKLDPNFAYVRFRAIGCLEVDGPNANFDAFPYGEFEDNRPNYGYKSFEGKRAFVEHASDNIENSIGSLYGSYLNRFNTSGFNFAPWRELNDDHRAGILAARADAEDGSIEVLMGIDKKLSPAVARMVDTDSPIGCSMGTNMDYSECSVCGHRAHFEHEYCGCIKYSKGGRVFVPASQLYDLIKKATLRPEWLKWVLHRESDRKAVMANDRRMVHANIFEINYGLSFFELSVVANPAFNRGYKLEKIAMQRLGFRQLIPLVVTPDKEVEVRFNVSEPFFTRAVTAYAAAMDYSFDEWENVDKVEFLRNGDVAKSALISNAVEKVLVAQIDVPAIQSIGVIVEPSNDAGFYEITNPERLLEAKYAKIIQPHKLTCAAGVPEEKFYGCAYCKQVYSRDPKAGGQIPYYKEFTQHSICTECARGIVEKEYKNYKHSYEIPSQVIYKNKDLFNYNDFESLVSHGSTPQELVDELYRHARNNPRFTTQVDEYINLLRARFGDLVTRNYSEGGKMTLRQTKATYDGLPSTALDVTNQGINIEKTEMNEFKNGAQIGSNMIDKEKETRENGTIFVDAITARKQITDMRTKVGQVKSAVEKGIALSKKVKAMDDFLSGVKDDIDSDDFIGDVDLDEPQEPLSIEEAEEVLENTIADLEEVKKAIEEKIEPELGQDEEDLDSVLANRKRWSESLKTRAAGLSSSVSGILTDAVEATTFARKTLKKILTNTKNTTVGGAHMVTGDKGPGLVLNKDNLVLLREFASIVNKGGEMPAALKEYWAGKGKDGDMKDKDDKEKDKKDDKDKDVKKDEKKDEKKAAEIKQAGEGDTGTYPGKVEDSAAKNEDKYGPAFKHVKVSDPCGHTASNRRAKEGASMPPTGARDPGDYGDPGGIESIELRTWWEGMYPEFEKIKSKERSTDLNSPDGRVDLLTGVVAKLFRNPLMASKSRYAVIKVGEDLSVQDGFVATFENVAGDNQTEQTYGEFTSPGYLDNIMDAARSDGFDSVVSAMSGNRLTKAQMEGLTPGKTEKVNPLYNTYEEKKDSNKKRPGEHLDDVKSAANDKAYYADAFKDPGYAAEMVKKYKLAAEAAVSRAKAAEGQVATLEAKEAARKLAQKAVALAKKAASRGVIPFTQSHIKTKAQEYLNLDDVGYGEINKMLDGMKIVEARAIEAYQIPEAENMQRGVVHQTLNTVNHIREEGGAAESLNVEGIQPAVENNSKISAKASVVPQMTTPVANQGEGTGIPNFTNRFTTIGNRLRQTGQFDSVQHLLNRRRISR